MDGTSKQRGDFKENGKIKIILHQVGKRLEISWTHSEEGRLEILLHT